MQGAPRTVYGTLVLVSADNPASSALGGFKESMSALRYCRHCKATNEEASSQVHDIVHVHVCVCMHEE